MKDLKGTKTEQNLLNSFAGESMAHLRYAMFEEVARKEGHAEAAKFFSEAKNEEAGHAKLWYSLLNGGKVPTTKVNIDYQIQKENEEWTDVENSYEHMAKVAKEEGFEDIAKHFEEVASEEEDHESHLHDLLKTLKHDKHVDGDGCCMFDDGSQE